jgi:hypothetical protein
MSRGNESGNSAFASSLKSDCNATLADMTELYAFQTLTSCLSPAACCFSTLDISRNVARYPPLKLLRDAAALPFGDFGPVDFSHGLHFLINLALKARCSGVRK